MRILFIGDVVGKPGRTVVSQHLPKIKKRYDFVIANGENAAGGFGLNTESFDALIQAGVDAITLGNHVWDNREIFSFIDDPRIIRPINYPIGAPGRGFATFDVNGEPLTIVNAMGRVFMDALDDPFASLENLLYANDQDFGAIFVDFHAEATSEKAALARFLDGRVAAVVGTHTHVATADTRFLPEGTAFQSDVGMTGPIESIIGIEPAGPIGQFRTKLPTRFAVATGLAEINAVEMDIENDKVTRIARYRYRQDEISGQFDGEITNS